MTYQMSFEGVRIVTLGCTEQTRTADRLCRKLLRRGNALTAHAGHSPHIVICGSDWLRELDGLLASTEAEFDLLVAFDGGVLDYPALLSRCRQVLISPFEDDLLGRHLDAIFSQSGPDPMIAALLERNIIGQSETMAALRRRIAKVASHEAPVVISGETGTGKDLVARAVHYCSRRQDQSCVPLNCAALHDELLLAELFGHERGAFTDARQARRGLVGQADGGTLFLDEVDSLSQRAQGALLRFLQDRDYRPVGSERLYHADVRVVCATNRDLRRCVEEGRFREDLYYRLNVIDLVVPPLREREGDIELLSEHFLTQLAHRYQEPGKRLHELTLRWMNAYHWPGNVRELENHLHRNHVTTNGPSICVPSIKGNSISVIGGERAAGGLGQFQHEKARVVARFERDYLQRALDGSGGNISAAARQAGKERRAFTRLLEKHGIDCHRSNRVASVAVECKE
jgi:DNA-binding NtrC family response regulator